MIKISFAELEELKTKLTEEIFICKECRMEHNLGFKYCDYHKYVIKFIQSWTLEK